MSDCPVCGRPVSQRRKARNWPYVNGQRAHVRCDTPESKLLAAIFRRFIDENDPASSSAEKTFRQGLR